MFQSKYSPTGDTCASVTKGKKRQSIVNRRKRQWKNNNIGKKVDYFLASKNKKKTKREKKLDALI